MIRIEIIVPLKIQSGRNYGYTNDAVYQRKGEFIMDYAAESLKLHYEWKGKLDMTPKMKLENKDYSPRCRRQQGGSFSCLYTGCRTALSGDSEGRQ